MDGSTTEAPTTPDSETPEPTVTEMTETAESDSPEESESLGESGKRALKTEREARKAAEKELETLRDEVSRLRRSNAAQKGTDIEAIKDEIRAEYAATLTEAAIRAEAKGRLTDPADALLYIKASDLDHSDEAAITAAVDKLLEAKPYLAASTTARWGDVGTGAGKAEAPEPRSAQERLMRAYDTKR